LVCPPWSEASESLVIFLKYLFKGDELQHRYTLTLAWFTCHNLSNISLKAIYELFWLGGRSHCSFQDEVHVTVSLTNSTAVSPQFL